MCKQSKVMRLWLISNLPLLAANGLMNGSRAGIYGIAIVAAGIAIVSLKYKLGPNQTRVIGTMVTASLVIAIGATYWFADALMMWKLRSENTGDNLNSRVVKTAQQSVDIAINQIGLFGYGMGVTLPVTAQLRNALGLAKPKKTPPSMDHEMMQLVVELGLFGSLAWYALRLLVLMYGIRLFRDSAPTELRAIFLVSILVQIPYFYSSVVINHTANILLWGFIGLSFIPALQPTVIRRLHAVPNPMNIASTEPTSPFRRRGSKVR
jgi:hypothetical protein